MRYLRQTPFTKRSWIPDNVTGDLWFRATLYDAYFGFLTFYGWVLYKERSIFMRVLWFLLVMAGGNAAMSTYLLVQLAKLPKDASFEDLLLVRSR